MTRKCHRAHLALVAAGCVLVAAAAAWPAATSRQLLVIATSNMRGTVRTCG